MRCSVRKILPVVALVMGLTAQANTLSAEAREVLAETQGSDVAERISPNRDVVDGAVASPAPKNEASAIPESQIPLHLEDKVAEANPGGGMGRVLIGLIALVAIVGGAWFLNRRLARPSQRKNAPQIKILNQHWLGPKKSLAIIRVAGESILIGVTEQNISLIKPLALLDEEVQADGASDFPEVLSDLGLKGAAIDETPMEGEDFQMGGLHQIKDMVSRRLRQMRSID